MTSDTLQSIKRLGLTITGAVLVGFGIVVMLLGFGVIPNWLPSAVGILAAIGITVSFLTAAPSAAKAANDELSRATEYKAYATGYWLFVFAYIPFGAALYFDVLSASQAFASLGTICGGLPLLYFAYLDMRGS
ncbi:MAG: hypothetical protein ABJL67_09145 [Sulfitobacter sp.]